VQQVRKGQAAAPAGREAAADLARADELRALLDAAGDLVFFTTNGRQRDGNNVRVNVLAGVIKRANAKLAEAGKPPIIGLTNHSLRRTFASLLYEAGASPAYVMGQMGHTSSALALEVYSKMMSRDRDRRPRRRPDSGR
jgi:integrase